MSNMYPEVITRNPLGGKCPHDCRYCYMKSYPFNQTEKYKGKHFIDEKELKRIKDEEKVIFICSGNDLFAEGVPQDFLITILNRCQEFRSNEYLFQTKNPRRFYPYATFWIPINSTLGTTIETNRNYNLSKAPTPSQRYESMVVLPNIQEKMISIEPILDFDLETMVRWMKLIQPKYVSIGADSKRNNLPEPSPEKVRELIKELEKITEVRIKDNLKRMVKT